MRILLFVLALFCGLETFAQYELLTDPRSGKPVRYAGDLAAKPDVVVPKYYRPGKKEFRGVWVATVENIDFPVSGSVQSCLVVVDIFKRNIRMGQGKFFQHVTDVGALCLCRL